MDRTTEFKSFLGSPSVSTNITGARPGSFETESSGNTAARTGFNNDAARIGQEIHVTQLRLDELGKRMFLRLMYFTIHFSCPPEEYIQ